MKIIIVDDDCLVAGALKTILEANPDIQVAATGSDGEEACSLYREYLPDILLMDIRMKGMDGLEASRKILREFPEAKILLLTTFSDDEYIVKALRLGTKGYLLKQDYASILPALQAVYSGQTVFGTEIVSRIPELLQSSTAFDYSTYGINERELEIIERIANGYSNKMETVSGGMGLSNIRDRVKALGGTVQITQEKGFRIFVTIPKSGSN